MELPLLKMMTFGMLPSSLKLFIYRAKGAKIGKNVSLGFGSIIDARSIEIGSDTRIGHLSMISARSLRLGSRVSIGSMVAVKTGKAEISDDTIVGEQVIIGGMETPESSIYIGKRCEIFPFAFLNTTSPITIEDEVGIGGSTYIFTHGVWQPILDGFPVEYGPVTIKRGVWLPWRVFIMPNVTIGEYATIGACSVITRDVPARSLAVGIPARIIKEGEEYIKPMTVQDKDRIIHEILKKFCKWLAYIGYSVRRDPIEGGLFLTITRTRNLLFRSKIETWRLVYQSEFLHNADLRNLDVVLSLSAISNGMMNELSTKKISWFDLNARRCSKLTNPINEELKAFLKRYGIQFEPT